MPGEIPVIDCRLLYRSTSPHLQQLYTGLLCLHRNGVLRLSQRRRRTPIRYESDATHLRDAGHAHLNLILNGGLRLHFDTHDAADIATGELEDCDFYFKRSYSSAHAGRLPRHQAQKVRPLGLNYRVLPDCIDHFAIRRALLRPDPAGSPSSSRMLLEAVDHRNRLAFRPRLALMQEDPAPSRDARALFLVAAYDPASPQLGEHEIEDRIRINESRASCLRLLKAELGERFTGGFVPTSFTQFRYPELVAPRDWVYQQRYLAAVRAHPVCIATTGLHRSIGWKLAEYIAFARAVVTEELQFEVPGELAAGRNYVSFGTQEECVQATVMLLRDSELRAHLMHSNAAYYRTWLRPDALVMNALRVALHA